MSRYIVDSKKDLLAYEQLICTPLRCLEDADKAIDDAYQRGLNDAWEAARKIFGDVAYGGLTLNVLSEIFGTKGYSFILQENTAREAITKLKAYEQKQTKRDIGNDIDYLMQSTGMTVEEIAQRLKEMRN